MPCKLDSTENLRSFDKYPTPPSKSQKIKNEGFAVPSRDKDRCLSQNSNLENLDCLQMLYKRRCGREGPDRCVAGRGFYWAACYSEGGGGGEEQLGKQGQEMEETVRVSGSKRRHRNPFPCAALVSKNRLLGLANFLGGKMGPFFRILIFSYPPFRLV